jgi:hypothetical protein
MKHCRNYDREKNTVFIKHPLSLLLCLLQIPHGLTGDLVFHSKRPATIHLSLGMEKSSMNTHKIVWAHICGHTYTHIYVILSLLTYGAPVWIDAMKYEHSTSIHQWKQTRARSRGPAQLSS